jgi:hypothetical protein
MKSFLEAFPDNKVLGDFISQAQMLGRLRHMVEAAQLFRRYVWGSPEGKPPVDPNEHAWAYGDRRFFVQFVMEPNQPAYLYVRTTKGSSEGSGRESVALSPDQALRARKALAELAQITEDAAHAQILRTDQQLQEPFESGLEEE